MKPSLDGLEKLVGAAAVQLDPRERLSLVGAVLGDAEVRAPEENGRLRARVDAREDEGTDICPSRPCCR